ncbi:hypothetical protein BRADI_4g05856v3 [Brachypodium distachyon]|uniref:Uncharacterized protein n=1 Tax=Brachypodium distachyon TaxID=15368 RepID=A0A0Q3EFL3_BRADI|nr:hypothetical protein BRADI_4g05856v3 [Brachypodium distachyon]
MKGALFLALSRALSGGRSKSSSKIIGFACPSFLRVLRRPFVPMVLLLAGGDRRHALLFRGASLGL